MNTQLEVLIKSCTVKILIPGQMGWGTGFFVDKGLILTCAHVVRKAVDKPVKVFWPFKAKTLSATVDPKNFFDDGKTLDIALLSLAEPYPDDHPCVLLDEASVAFGQELYSYGFLKSYPNAASVDSINESLTGDTPPLLKFKAGHIEPGLSGAVLINLKTGMVCGMVKQTHDSYLDMGGGAVPTSVILEKIPWLKERQEKFHKYDNRWKRLLPVPENVVREVNAKIEEILLNAQLTKPGAGLKIRRNILRLKHLTELFPQLGVVLPEISCATFKDLNLAPQEGLLSRELVTNFAFCTLQRCDFSGAKLDFAIFDNANLHRSVFENAQLIMASFRGSNLRSCEFNSSNAFMANFSNADLTSAQFQKANLAGAKFIDSDLMDVSFVNANLNSANLTGARNISFEQLQDAKTLFLASGIEESIISKLCEERPDLLQKPARKEDLLICEHNDKRELRRFTTYFYKLLAGMTVDEFEEFLAMFPPFWQGEFMRMRHELRYGPQDEAHLPNISVQIFFEWLAEALKERLDMFDRRITVSFAVKNEGYYLLDTHNPQLISRRWDDESDVGIICNQKTLSDIWQGCFDYNNPQPEHLFFWSGDADVLKILSNVLSRAP